MGTGKQARRKGIASKKKSYKKACSTKRRVKDLDQIQDEIRKVEEEGPKPRPLDDSLPGLGQHYCMVCARYFINATVLAKHLTTKQHKKRLKQTKEPQYTHAEAASGAGQGSTPAHVLQATGAAGMATIQ